MPMVLRCSLAILFLIPVYAWSAASKPLSDITRERVTNATVFLRCPTFSGGMCGTGFFIERNLIITNAHVVGHQKALCEVVLYSGMPGKETIVKGDVLETEAGGDLAFVRVNTTERKEVKWPEPLSLIDSASVEQEMQIFICGFPFGLARAKETANPPVRFDDGTVTKALFDSDGLLIALELNGEMNPGNSGGPCVDSRGRVVAVSVAKLIGTKTCFGIPCDSIRRYYAGRVNTQSVTVTSRDECSCSFDVSIRVKDPLQRINRVSLYYFTGKPGDERPLHPTKKIMIYGARNDGPRQSLPLAFDAASGLWRGQVKNTGLRPDQDLWTAAATFAPGSAESMAEAVPVPLPPIRIDIPVRTRDEAGTLSVVIRTPPPTFRLADPKLAPPQALQTAARYKGDAVPPATASVDEPVVYTPEIEKPTSAADVFFKLKKKVGNMAVNSKTGELTFFPTTRDLGRHAIEIVMMVDGLEKPVASWTLKVVQE